MEKQMIRLLEAGEIECRISIINEKGLSLLLYKDARVDQRILDETFGAFGWKRSHQSIDGNLYCTVEIRDMETGEWIAKQDVGTVSYSEKEKGQASDSFKRACFNWGIGRELYTAPFIWIPASKASIQKVNDKYYCREQFQVAFISYNDFREISGLSIVNEKQQSVYVWKAKSNNLPEQKGSTVSDEQMAFLVEELERTGVAMEAVQERYHIKDPTKMPTGLYDRVMKALAKTKTTQVA